MCCNARCSHGNTNRQVDLDSFCYCLRWCECAFATSSILTSLVGRMWSIFNTCRCMVLLTEIVVLRPVDVGIFVSLSYACLDSSTVPDIIPSWVYYAIFVDASVLTPLCDHSSQSSSVFVICLLYYAPLWFYVCIMGFYCPLPVD